MEDDREQEGGNGGRARQPDRFGARSRWEWVAGAVSTLLVLLLIGFVAYEALHRSPAPPVVDVQPDSVLRAGGIWLVPFRAHNRGGATAAAVHVRGQLYEGARAVETSEATVDYVPPRSVRDGGLYFRADPRAYRLELRALGYERP